MNYSILILNKNYIPTFVTTFKKAIILLFKNKAKILDVNSYDTYDWHDWIKQDICGYKKIRTPYREINIPEIIILKDYDKIQKKRLILNKRNIYKRDQGRCQYCYKFLSFKDSTIDHIRPRSKNGKCSWDNCVISCVKCNFKKGDNLLDECGMKLISEPKTPSYDRINFTFLECSAPKSWLLFTKN